MANGPKTNEPNKADKPNETYSRVLPQFCWMAFQQHKIEHIEFFF